MKKYKCSSRCGDTAIEDVCVLSLPEDQTVMEPLFCPFDGSEVVWVNDDDNE